MTMIANKEAFASKAKMESNVAALKIEIMKILDAANGSLVPQSMLFDALHKAGFDKRLAAPGVVSVAMDALEVEGKVHREGKVDLTPQEAAVIAPKEPVQ